MNGYFLPTEASRAEFFDRFKTKCDAGRIGRSILGRSIEYYKLGCGKRNILAVGAHHAAEHITASALFAFIELLCGGGGSRECRDALSMACFWIVPCLNPDGVEMQICGPSASPLYERQLRMNGDEDFSLWQANARGVDLNHNYDAGFGEYKRMERCEGIFAGRSRYSGEYPESEPETRAMASFVRALMPDVSVALHTQGGEVYVKPQNEACRRIGERVSSALGYTLSVPQGSAAYGGLCDYTGDSLGIPSFTVELGRGKNPLPSSAFPEICEAVNILLPLLATLPDEMLINCKY